MANKKQDTVFHNATLTGIIDFASVHAPRAKYGKENSKFDNDKEFSLNLRMDDEETLAAFNKLSKELNISATVLNPKTGQQVPRLKTNAKTGGLFLHLKRNAVTATGEPSKLPVVDADGEAIPKDVLIGNGSKATAHLSVLVDIKTKEVRSILLTGLQVWELMSYSGPAFKVQSKKVSNPISYTDDERTDMSGHF